MLGPIPISQPAHHTHHHHHREGMELQSHAHSDSEINPTEKKKIDWERLDSVGPFLPPFLLDQYKASVQETAEFDKAIKENLIAPLGSKLNGISVLIGIPYFNELSNIISVIVTLAEAFQQRKTPAMILILGEFSRADMVDAINVAELQEGMDYARIQTSWKPHPKFVQKPWSVRAFQTVAASANQGEGTHLVIIDADIQFNHWELSAASLLHSLFDPLTQDPPLGMIVLNAPRSFMVDDGIVHLFSSLFEYGIFGAGIHQIYGGEFSLHKDLNKRLLHDETIVQREVYCLQCQLASRALTLSQISGTKTEVEENVYPAFKFSKIREYQMKGKWHAKITLDKLLEFKTDPNGKCRVDWVTEKMFNDAILFSTFFQHAPVAQHVENEVIEYSLGGLTKQVPDPQEVSMRVLAPSCAKTQICRAMRELYLRFLTQHVNSPNSSLPLDCYFVQSVLSRLHQLYQNRGEGKSAAACIRIAPGKDGAENEKILVWSPRNWAKCTWELVKIYRDSKTEGQRLAAIRASCIAWLMGSIAFLNEVGSGNWGEMLRFVKEHFMVPFREEYLHLFGVAKK